MVDIKRLASALGLTLGLGLVLTHQGCGGATPAAEVPESVAWQLRGCADEHSHHVGSGQHSVSFDVKLSDDGTVDSVVLRDSTLPDRELELCMAGALRSLSEADLPVRLSEARPRDAVAPESRMLLGHPEAVAACLASPPCWLAAGFFLGAAYISLRIYMYAANSHPPSVAKPQSRPPTQPAQNPKLGGDPSTTGPTPPVPPLPPECPRNENFAPLKTDNATGCLDKKDNLQCYSRRHPPCAGVHTHGRLKYQEIRNGICMEVDKKAVRCEGPFEISGPCGSISTVGCGKEGHQTSGIFEE